MLLQFNFKNFKSFRDETTLDLTAAQVSEHGDHVIAIGSERVLPVASIFGANASGKSNVQEALRYMMTYVVFSFGYGGNSDGKDRQTRRISAPTFLLDSRSREAASSFEVYFIDSVEHGAKIFNYGFTQDRNGIREEWLNYKAKSARGKFKRVFYRNNEELDLSGIAQKSRENIKVSLEKEALIVSLGAKLKIPKLKFVRDWVLNMEFADFGRPVENYFLSTQLPPKFTSDASVRRKVVDYLAAFDPSIIDFKVETIEKDPEKGPSNVKINALHKMADSDDVAYIPLKLESAGTLKMFALYPLLQDVLLSGSVLFVDELNARLHPLLVRLFVVTFLNPEINKNHAQLIFTTHDSWQLNNNMLRRDEVWFTEKGQDGVSSLYSLADFVDCDGSKIRKDENYEKNYLLGKYGAIPTLKYLEMFKENEDE